MIFRKELFWDVDVQNLDLDLHKSFIIERITARGKYSEFKELIELYSLNVVSETLKKARYLDEKTLAYCSVIFNISKEEFRCYRLGRSNPIPYTY